MEQDDQVDLNQSMLSTLHEEENVQHLDVDVLGLEEDCQDQLVEGHINQQEFIPQQDVDQESLYDEREERNAENLAQHGQKRTQNEQIVSEKIEGRRKQERYAREESARDRNSYSSHEKTNLKKRMTKREKKKELMKKRTQIKVKTSCPICDKRYESGWSVRRHMEGHHGISMGTIKKDYKIEPTKKQCPFCNYWFGGIHSHMKVCKKRLMGEEKTEIGRPQNEDENEEPVRFSAGGVVFMEKFEKWIEKDGGVAPSTAHKYCLKAGQLTKHFELAIKDFLMDSLLAPVESEVFLPMLDSYLLEAKSDNVRSLACKVYLHICDFVIYNFSQKYTASTSTSMADRKAFKEDVLINRNIISSKIRKFNRGATLSTGLNAEERTQDKEDLKYNPERCGELINEMISNEELKSKLKDLNQMTIEEVRENYGDGTELVLMIGGFMLTTTGGKRPSAISRMKIGEFKKAWTNKDGTKIVRVKDHKAKKTYSVDPAVFVIDGLYGAVEIFLATYRDGAGEKEYLLSLTGKEMNMERVNKWMKQFMTMTDKEQKTCTPEVWRHAVGNLARKNKDPKIGRLAQAAMCHSEGVFNSNYKVTDMEGAAFFAKGVIEGLRSESMSEEDSESAHAKKKQTLREGAKRMPRKPMQEKTGASGIITDEDRKILKRELFEDGKPPKILNLKKLQLAKKNIEFRKVWKKIIKAKDGDDRAAMNTIRKSIMPKPKKAQAMDEVGERKEAKKKRKHKKDATSDEDE